MDSSKKYQEAGKDIFHKLHLATYPVAIKYIKDEEQFDPGTIRPSAVDQKWSICQAFTYARRWGMTVGMTEKDNFCVPGTMMHHWVELPWEEFIRSQIIQGWHKDEEAERKNCAVYLEMIGEKNIEQAREYTGFICSPLHQTNFEPDTVLIFGDGEKITHLIHALTYEGKHHPTSAFAGFGESCLKGGLIPFLTGAPQVVVPGMGDRAFSGIHDHEIGIGMPAGLVFDTTANLFKAGGRLNLGLPAKPLLPTGITESITPGFQYLRDKLEEKKK